MNESVVVDLIWPMRTLIKFLNFVGLWPKQHKSMGSWFFYGIYTIIFQTIFTFSYDFFKCINFLFLTDLDIITRAMFICFTEIALAVKIVNFYFRMRTMQTCLNYIQKIKIENQYEADAFTSNFSFLSKIIKWYLITANVTGIFSYLSPLLVAEPILPYPGWYPLDWFNSTLYYWLIYAYQVIGMFLQIQTLVIIESYFIYLMVTISVQLDILSNRIKKIGYMDNVNESDIDMVEMQEQNNQQTLVDCIKEHCKVLM